MTAWLGLVAFIALQRVVELAWATRNARRLLAAGATEAGRGHYRLFIALHGSWLAGLVLLIPTGAALDPLFLVAFVLLQAVRLWIIVTLGRYWTTRIINLPGVPLVRRGAYRYLRHPNYLVVALEIPTVPLIAGAWQIALVFGTLNLALLAYRIRIEDDVLAIRRSALP